MENTGEIIITLSSTERHFAFDRLGLTFNSTDSEILNAIKPVILEEEGFDMDDREDEYFTVKKVESSGNCYVFPKSVAGLS